MQWARSDKRREARVLNAPLLGNRMEQISGFASKYGTQTLHNSYTQDETLCVLRQRRIEVYESKVQLQIEMIHIRMAYLIGTYWFRTLCDYFVVSLVYMYFSL